MAEVHLNKLLNKSFDINLIKGKRSSKKREKSCVDFELIFDSLKIHLKKKDRRLIVYGLETETHKDVFWKSIHIYVDKYLHYKHKSTSLLTIC